MLQLEKIGRRYPGVVALDGVDFSLDPGEVVGLIGENGAGKSTLMKILGGIIPPSEGTIRLDGVAHAALSVTEATRAGIAFVHQELEVFDNLDVAANVFIGREPCGFGPLRLIRTRELERRVQPLLDRLGADFGPRTPVADLSIAQRQMVEIAKALSIDARVIIMDEPTSSLTLSETDRLLRIIAELKASGVAVIYISHRLAEVKQCADRVVCLRDGRVAGELGRDAIEHAAMIRLMIGRDLRSLYIPPRTPPREEGCVIRDVVPAAMPEAHVSLTVRKGEILGLAGLVGAGRTSLARALFGVDPLRGGTIALHGTPVRIRSPREAIAHGLYLVPEDRKREGLVLNLPLTQNVTLPNLRAFARRLLVDRHAETACFTRERTRLGIRAADGSVPAVTLSGGNQQKIVLAKWLSMRPRMIIFDEPTRGIDVGAKEEIYRLMRDLADAGVTILMISSDMEEVLGVSDRIAVMHAGRVTGVLERPDFSELNVLRLAIGEAAEAA
ncbi:MAG: D-xylose ABC transporter ATP-binding protein [Rhodospirillales bacterium 69-11]|nr:sugar ABC transporter ATP-binding protein [Rhodospirillales bacterium]OJW22770.1 MAG: D-xylose ABC transporter ATP-binding protein [Rhodospirillales bacterium 69-11]